MSDVNGKVVIVTGATGGLGSAVTARLVAGGAKLVLVERDPARLENYSGGGDVLKVTADVGSADEAARVVHEAHARFGRIDGLAHTVGGFTMGKTVSDPAVFDQFEQMWKANVLPVVAMAGAVAGYMTENQIKGSLVVIAAKSALKGAGKMSAYTASKSAALRVVESLAAEVKEQGIRVNALLPSTIDTPANRKDMPNANFDKWVKAEQIADTIAFLISEAGGGIYGANLEISGQV